MENIVHRSGQVDKGGDVVVDELKIWIPREVGNVGGIAGQEIVENNDAVAGGQ